MFREKISRFDIECFLTENIGITVDAISYNPQEGYLKFSYLDKRSLPHYELQTAIVSDKHFTLTPSGDPLDKWWQEFLTAKFGKEYTDFLKDNSAQK